MSVIVRLVAKGFVHGIGFRAYVKQCALRLKIKGTVKNLADGSVEIYCNAPNPEIYERFKSLIHMAPGAEIDSLEEYFEGTDGYGTGPKEWLGFNVLRDEVGSMEETLEYIVLGGQQMLTLQKQTIDLQKQTIDLQKQTLEKQDKMLEKQDKMLEKQDKMLEKQDKTIEILERMDNKLDVRFDNLDRSVNALTDTVNEKFDWLAERYGEFGEIMKSLNEKMDKIANMYEDIHEMKEAFVKLTDYITNKG